MALTVTLEPAKATSRGGLFFCPQRSAPPCPHGGNKSPAKCRASCSSTAPTYKQAIVQARELLRTLTDPETTAEQLDALRPAAAQLLLHCPTLAERQTNHDALPDLLGPPPPFSRLHGHFQVDAIVSVTRPPEVNASCWTGFCRQNRAPAAVITSLHLWQHVLVQVVGNREVACDVVVIDPQRIERRVVALVHPLHILLREGI